MTDIMTYTEELDEDCICLACYEHSAVLVSYENGEEVERVSSCCGSSVWQS